MVQRRINFSDIIPGAPLPWDLYSIEQSGEPLLRKGQLASDKNLLRRLLDAGLYVRDEAPPSVLHLLNESNHRLERLLHELRSKENAEQELRAIAAEVLRAYELNPDIALACVLLNQIAGTYAVRHCIETALVAILVAGGMGKGRKETLLITVAALTMNVGMLRHNELFQNKNTPLTSEEQAIVRRHPEESAEMLNCVGVDDEEWISCVMLHHENDDGSGYPGGKTSDQISQNAKLIGLADRYCAHVSARNYRRSILPDLALRNIFLEPKSPIDPVLAEQFVRQLGKYPPGSLVRLHNGEIGVVTQRGLDADGIQVHALRDSAGVAIPAATLAALAPRSTSAPEFAIAESLHEDDVGVRFSMKNVWGDQARL